MPFWKSHPELSLHFSFIRNALPQSIGRAFLDWKRANQKPWKSSFADFCEKLPSEVHSNVKPPGTSIASSVQTLRLLDPINTSSLRCAINRMGSDAGCLKALALGLNGLCLCLLKSEFPLGLTLSALSDIFIRVQRSVLEGERLLHFWLSDNCSGGYVTRPMKKQGTSHGWILCCCVREVKAVNIKYVSSEQSHCSAAFVN